jgi:hypothetical protein
MENLITSLCIWNSIALQVPEGDFRVKARNFFSGLKKLVTGILCVIPVVAFAAAVITAPPAAVTIPGSAIQAPVTVPAAALTAGIGAVINDLIPRPEN